MWKLNFSGIFYEFLAMLLLCCHTDNSIARLKIYDTFSSLKNLSLLDTMFYPCNTLDRICPKILIGHFIILEAIQEPIILQSPCAQIKFISNFGCHTPFAHFGNYQARDMSFGRNNTWVQKDTLWKFDQDRIINTEDIRKYLIL